MIGKEHQRHECNKPYGTFYGDRNSYVSTLKDTKGKKRKKKKVNSEKVSERFNEMILNDCTYQEIAKELDLTPKLVKEYFISEGLM